MENMTERIIKLLEEKNILEYSHLKGEKLVTHHKTV